MNNRIGIDTVRRISLKNLYYKSCSIIILIKYRNANIYDNFFVILDHIYIDNQSYIKKLHITGS